MEYSIWLRNVLCNGIKIKFREGFSVVILMPTIHLASISFLFTVSTGHEN